MEKILVKYNKSQGKVPITEVIPGCVTRTWIDISRDIKKEVLLMEDGSLKTDIPELAAWKDIISLHFLGHAIAGLTSTGSIRFYVANQRMQYKNYKEEWAEIWESLLAVDNVKQLIVWGSPYGTSRSGPFAVGLNYNGKLWLAGAMAVIGITSETWSNIDRLYDVWGGVLAVRKDRTLLGSGRFSTITGKRIVPEKQSGNDIWYLENNEVAYFPRGQDNISVLENVFKIIKYSMFDYAYLTCDGMVYSKHFDHFEEDANSRNIRRNAMDIHAFGDEGKYLAVLYRNGEVRVFINTHSENEAFSPLNDTDEFVINQNYKYFSGNVICKNAKSLRFESGELTAEIIEAAIPPENNKGLPSANDAPNQKPQRNENETDKYQWIPFEQSDEYQRYYDKIYGFIEPEIGKTEKISSCYPQNPLNIARVYTYTLYSDKVFILMKTGKVHFLDYAVRRQFSEDYDKGLNALLEWRDIVNIELNGSRVSGLKSDGTVVTTSGYDCSKWNNIVQIVMGSWFLAGLRKDGTVIMSSNKKNNSVLDTKKWRNISSLAAGARMELYGLTAEGKIISSHSGEPSRNLVEISTLSNVSSIAVGENAIYALTNTRDLITIPHCEYAPVDLTQTIRIFNSGEFVFAQQNDGHIVILNKGIHYEDDWADACAVEYFDSVIYSVRSDGTLKANWYKQDDVIKSKSTIDHLTTMKNIAGMYFIDGRWLQHNLNGVAVLYRNGLMSSFDSGLNDIVSSLNDVVDVCVISSQRTIAVQHSQSITFVTKRHQSGKTPYIYETNTLGNVQSMHLFDQDRSLLVMFSDGRFLSVGRVFYSSCTTREPLAYSKLFYRVEPEGTRSKKFKQEDYGIAGITKDNKPFILSDRLGFLISHVLFLENENDIVDCAKANMVQNERFCFLRQDGTVLTLDTDLIRIQDDIGRKTSIRYWNNVRKLISSDDWISAISKDNQFVMVQPSNTNQNILDVAKFTYWVPSKDEEDEFEVGDKGETIYTNEGASVILFLDGSLRITGERNLLPFYPLPIKSGIRRLLRNDRHFIVLGEDGVLWCSKVIFGRDDRRLPDGTKKFNKKFTKWEQARNGIIDIANRGDTVYLKVRQEEFDIINQGEGDKVTPVTDPEFLDFLTSQEYRSIAATRSIQKWSAPSLCTNQ